MTCWLRHWILDTGYGKDGLLCSIRGTDTSGVKRHASPRLWCGMGLQQVRIKPGESAKLT
jgi:hypothetical protein